MSQRILEILLGVKDRKMRRDLRRIEGDVGSFAKRTSHKLRSSFKDAFGGLAGVGTVAGIAAIGKGVIDVDRKMTRLGIQAGQSKAEMIGFHNQLRALSDDTGLSTEHLADAAARFVSLTGACAQANRGAEVFAKTSAASGASLEDVSAAAASLKNNLGIDDVAGFEKGLSIMLAQGKAGAVELREMASLLPTIAPTFTKFGTKGTQGLAELGAALQVVRQGFGSSAEAATGLNALSVALVRSAKKLKKAGVRVYEKDNRTLRNQLDIIRDISKARKLNSQGKLLDALGDTGAVRALSELIEKLNQVDTLVATGLGSNAVNDDFATYMESNAGRIEKAWQRLQNTLAREITPARLTFLVEAFEAVGRAAGFVVDNIKAIAVAFAAWKMAQWTRRIHSLATSLGTAAAAGTELAAASAEAGSKAPRALQAVSLPTADLAQTGGLLGTHGATGVSKFVAGLSALGNVASVATMGYELGTLLDKATGFSDWINDIETRKPTASRYDPTGEASKLRIFASQARESANKQETRLMLGRSGRLSGPQQAMFDADAEEAKLRALRGEAADLQRAADVIEFKERLRQSGFDWEKARAGNEDGGVGQVLPGLSGAVADAQGLQKVTPDAIKELLRSAADFTGKSAFDSETQALVRGVIEAQKLALRREERKDQIADEAVKAMQAWQRFGEALQERLGVRLHSPLADMVGREPAP